MFDVEILAGEFLQLRHVWAERELGGSATHFTQSFDRLADGFLLPTIGRPLFRFGRHEELDGSHNVVDVHRLPNRRPADLGCPSIIAKIRRHSFSTTHILFSR